MSSILKRLYNQVNWSEQFVNFFVVVFGVTIAFLVSDWNDSRVKKVKLGKILDYMELELIQDSLELVSFSEYFEESHLLVDSIYNGTADVTFNAFRINLFSMRSVAYNQFVAMSSDVDMELDSLSIKIQQYYETDVEMYRFLFDIVMRSQDDLSNEMIYNTPHFEDYNGFHKTEELNTYFRNDTVIRNLTIKYRGIIRQMPYVAKVFLKDNGELRKEIRKSRSNIH